MEKYGMNKKKLKYIMGKEEISVKLKNYKNVNFDDVKEEVYRIENS